MTRRIGPRMREIARYVAAHEGCSPQAAALSLTYHGGGSSNRYGYEVVNRARRARLVVWRPRDDKAGCGRLYSGQGPEG